GRIDVAELAGRFVAIRQELGQAVTLECAAHARALCPPLALNRMLANLVDNALRYGERARIRVEGEAGVVRLIVDDDRPGIPAEAL
ncbi:ATP-binding protein, partial [Salmonella enterica]|uniref:ATP-binding protein n=1 Tax=Salmonella enterica TaxID=28901 RepID=UPI003D2E21FD